MSPNTKRRKHVDLRPSDSFCTIDCPACEAPMVVYVAYGRFEHVIEACPDQCHKKYSQHQWYKIEQDAQDADAGERSDLERHYAEYDDD